MHPDPRVPDLTNLGAGAPTPPTGVSRPLEYCWSVPSKSLVVPGGFRNLDFISWTLVKKEVSRVVLKGCSLICQLDCKEHDTQ
jgi:hypothetical protein